MRSIPCRLLAFATLLLLAPSACRRDERAPEPAPAKKAETGGEVIATYRGRKLTSDAVAQEFERLPAPSRSYLTALDRKRQFVENLVMNDLLYEEGQKSGYDKEPDIERQVNDMRKRLVVQRVMRQYQNPPNITDEQVRAYYDQNPTIYSTTQIHASHILLKDEDTARQILAQVKANPDKFADIAREKSTDTISAKKGGDLGTFGSGPLGDHDRHVTWHRGNERIDQGRVPVTILGINLHSGVTQVTRIFN